MTEREIKEEAVKRTRAMGYKPCSCGNCHVTLEYKRHVRAFERAIRFGVTAGYNQAVKDVDAIAEHDEGVI